MCKAQNKIVTIILRSGNVGAEGCHFHMSRYPTGHGTVGVTISGPIQYKDAIIPV